MLVDYHLHLERGPYSLDWLSRFVKTAQSRGVAELAVTEHGHRFAEFKEALGPLLGDESVPTGSMLKQQESGCFPASRSWLRKEFSQRLDDYVALVQKGKDAGMPILLGLEVDYLPGVSDGLRALLCSREWDFVLGSVHFIDGWGFDVSPELGWTEVDVEWAYERYFQLLKEAATSGLFDCLAHPDVIKVFGHRSKACSSSMLKAVVEAIANTGLCVEVSAAGLRRPVGEIYPARDFLDLCFENNVPITLASDAHEPEDAGRGIAEAAQWARKSGYTKVAVFRRRSYKLHALG